MSTSLPHQVQLLQKQQDGEGFHLRGVAIARACLCGHFLGCLLCQLDEPLHFERALQLDFLPHHLDHVCWVLVLRNTHPAQSAQSLAVAQPAATCTLALLWTLARHFQPSRSNVIRHLTLFLYWIP